MNNTLQGLATDSPRWFISNNLLQCNVTITCEAFFPPECTIACYALVVYIKCKQNIQKYWTTPVCSLFCLLSPDNATTSTHSTVGQTRYNHKFVVSNRLYPGSLMHPMKIVKQNWAKMLFHLGPNWNRPADKGEKFDKYFVPKPAPSRSTNWTALIIFIWNLNDVSNNA